ncbi:hypothetical protein SEPCBS119000_000210 [Sporothrix epigloea]|uniref:Uncharacterized protein n=1 Tax=Sporothrix epigloea TaxID=1892477 RepID=A0ABP0D7H1_9PEZI
MTTFRNGGLNLTRRWEGTTVQDVGDWKDSKTIEIEMKLFYTSHMHRYDLCDVPLKFHVRAFIPTKGDVVSRKWIKKVKLPDGSIVFQKRYVHFPPFALADAHATVEIFRDYFEKNAIGAMLHVAQFSHPVVREHFEAAVEHLYSLPDGDVEKFFLQKFIKLWFCVRFTTGTDYLSGTEKLGCLPVPDADYPLGDRISVPRMITAQGDSIIVSRLLRPLTQELIPELEKIFRIGNPDNWFLLYVCTFILLSEISFSCQDRRRHAQENWLKQKYTLPEFVGELQFGTNIILCYWHYYRTMDPMDDGWDVFCKTIQPPTRPRAEIESAKGKGKKRVHLTHSQRALVTRHWRSMVETANMMDTPEYRECYEHPLYFVCQMYTKGWQIRDHYKRGPPDEPEDIA